MARLPRIVLPGIPHHVTQRGNRRERTFFEDGDYALYLDLLADAAGRAGVEVWSYCLMPNHLHIIAVPSDGDGLRRTFRYVHRHYTGYINARLRVTGHLWQGRFSSVAMDEPHFVTALRYVALNPVRARLVTRAADWRWSSTRALLAGADDHVVKVGPALERIGDFAAFLSEDFDEALTYAALRKAESVGRPIGSSDWLADIEHRLGKVLTPGKPGRSGGIFRGYCTCHRNSGLDQLAAAYNAQAYGANLLAAQLKGKPQSGCPAVPNPGAGKSNLDSIIADARLDHAVNAQMLCGLDDRAQLFIKRLPARFGGPYDFKANIRGAAEYGNFVFGAISQVHGLSLGAAQAWGAGAQVVQDGLQGKANFHGDNPGDPEQIAAGYNYAKGGCNAH